MSTRITNLALHKRFTRTQPLKEVQEEYSWTSTGLQASILNPVTPNLFYALAGSAGASLDQLFAALIKELDGCV